MVAKLGFLVLSAGLLASCGPAAPPLEDELFGIRLGCDTTELVGVHPGLYTHRLAAGEVLHEAGNQASMEVFTFAEEPWSPGRITYISARQESDVGVLRDSTGRLPDLAIDAATPRGLRLGDDRAAVLRMYGRPSEERSGTLVYRGGTPRPGAQVEHVQLFVSLGAGRVRGFSLQGDVPGVRRP